jgi:hypothetical protein
VVAAGASAALMALAGASVALTALAGASIGGASIAGAGATGSLIVAGAPPLETLGGGVSALPRPHLKKPAMVCLRS